MARTIQGFGTSFLGQRDFAPDGSYVTTEWIVFFFVPVIPMRSMRVTKSSRSSGPFRSTQNYLVHQRLPIHGRQVLSIYGFLVLCVALLFVEGMVAHLLRPNRPAGVALTAVVIAILCFVPWYLRSQAKKHVAAKSTQL